MAFAFLAAAALIGYWLSPDVVLRWLRRDLAATVGGQIITQNDLRQALHETLWREGTAWDQWDAKAQSQIRQWVLNRLIDASLVRYYRETSPSLAPNDSTVREEFTLWQKQFPEVGEGAQRLTLQSLSESSLEAGMRARAADQSWIEQQIAPMLAGMTALEAKKWYSENRESLRVPEAFRAAHIYLTRHDKTKPEREGEIRELYQQLTTGKDTFASLAAKFSEDDRSKVKGGDLDWFTAERMPADFMEAIGRLKVGEISAPVPTALGWHIIQLTDRKPAFIPPFETVRAEILAALRNQKQPEAVEGLLRKLRQRAERERLIHRYADVIEATVPPES